MNTMNYNNEMQIAWTDPVTPIPDLPLPDNLPIIDPNGWYWYPDANGQLFTLYFDADGNECTMWQLQDDGSFYWRCANVGYICQDIGIDGRKGIFFQNNFVGTMLLDNDLTVTWQPETYILPEAQINQEAHINHINNIQYDIHDNDNINYNFTEVNDISDEDDNNDE
jgi:hypothetical protein